MKLPRGTRLLLAGLTILAGLAAFAGTSDSAQTWIARRLLASRPDWGASLGGLSVGWSRIAVRDVVWVRDGIRLTLPRAEAELPLWALLWERRAPVRKFAAQGWILDLAGAGAAAGGRSPSAVASGRSDLRSVLATFEGILPGLTLPLDLNLGAIDVAGDVILPQGRGRVKVTLGGGGLQPEAEAVFPVSLRAELTSADISAATVSGEIRVRLGGPRRVAGVAVQGEVAAEGGRFPRGLRLEAAASVGRREGRETYAVSLRHEGRPLASVDGEFEPAAKGSLPAWRGGWLLDVRDDEVAPFLLGVLPPRFEVKGEGRFESDRTLDAVGARGVVQLEASELERWQESLRAVGPVRIDSHFDGERREDQVFIRRLEATLASGAPVAELRALQPFRFDPRTGRVQPTDAEQDLASVRLTGLPLRWLGPFLPGLTLGGGDAEGTLVARERGQAISWKVTRPVSVAGLRVSQGGREWGRDLDVSIEGGGDFSPQGWQAVLSRLAVGQSGGELLVLQGKVGRLAGEGEPWRLTGQLGGDLPRLLAQPALAGVRAPAAGRITAEFAASVGVKQEVQAKVWLAQLAAAEAGQPPTALPGVEVDLRAERDPAGQVVLRVPVQVVGADRRSELTLAATLRPAGRSLRAEAQLTGGDVFLEDLRSFAVLIPPRSAGGPPGGGPSGPAPWSGVDGSVAVHLRRVVQAGSFQLSNVTGTLRLGGGEVRLETGRASLGEGELRAAGTLSQAGGAGAFGLAAEVDAVGVNPAGWLGSAEPSVDGGFDFTSRWQGRAGSLRELLAQATGEVAATSRGGVFRGLPASAAAVAENSSRLTAWLASAGSALGALTGRRAEVDIAGRAPAVAELARALRPIAYDQLSVVLARSAAGHWSLRNFALISPELRLAGAGEAGGGEGEAGLALDLELRARGRAAELLRYLGALRGEPDALGYFPSTLPVHVGGTWTRPDAVELNQRLAALAVERNGLADKAVEWLSRWRGPKPAAGR